MGMLLIVSVVKQLAWKWLDVGWLVVGLVDRIF
jgi:hypothetical protein